MRKRSAGRPLTPHRACPPGSPAGEHHVVQCPDLEGRRGRRDVSEACRALGRPHEEWRVYQLQCRRVFGFAVHVDEQGIPWRSSGRRQRGVGGWRRQERRRVWPRSPTPAPAGTRHGATHCPSRAAMPAGPTRPRVSRQTAFDDHGLADVRSPGMCATSTGNLTAPRTPRCGRCARAVLRARLRGRR